MSYVIIISLLIIIVCYKKTKKIPHLDTSFLPETFIVFDLETTGLDPISNEIIEIGAIKVKRNSKHHDGFQSLIKPVKKIPARATAINGITQAMVDQDGRQLAEVLPEFIEFIGNHRLIAFNSDFDMGFINVAAQKLGYRIDNQSSCALKMARRAWPGLKSYKLESLAKIGGMTTPGNHRALKDCELATLVYMSAAAKLRQV
jgi:DNA polymerase III subunit epsilon